MHERLWNSRCLYSGRLGTSGSFGAVLLWYNPASCVYGQITTVSREVLVSIVCVGTTYNVIVSHSFGPSSAAVDSLQQSNCSCH